MRYKTQISDILINYYITGMYNKTAEELGLDIIARPSTNNIEVVANDIFIEEENVFTGEKDGTVKLITPMMFEPHEYEELRSFNTMRYINGHTVFSVLVEQSAEADVHSILKLMQERINKIFVRDLLDDNYLPELDDEYKAFYDGFKLSLSCRTVSLVDDLEQVEEFRYKIFIVNISYSITKDLIQSNDVKYYIKAPWLDGENQWTRVPISGVSDNIASSPEAHMFTSNPYTAQTPGSFGRSLGWQVILTEDTYSEFINDSSIDSSTYLLPNNIFKHLIRAWDTGTLNDFNRTFDIKIVYPYKLNKGDTTNYTTEMKAFCHNIQPVIELDTIMSINLGFMVNR